MRVDVDLTDKAKDIVLSEQALYVERGTPRGKERIIIILLSELYERRLKDSISPPPPMSNTVWKKYIKTK